jgi:hypothetical protein
LECSFGGILFSGKLYPSFLDVNSWLDSHISEVQVKVTKIILACVAELYGKARSSKLFETNLEREDLTDTFAALNKLPTAMQ